MQIFLFLASHYRENIIRKRKQLSDRHLKTLPRQRKCGRRHNKNSRGNHMKWTAPLLNLNLNYEKLQCKDRRYFIILQHPLPEF